MKKRLQRYVRNTLVLAASVFVLSSTAGNDGNLLISSAFAKDNSASSGIILKRSHPLIQNAIGIQERKTADLMKKSGVLGSGIGVRDDGEAVITVYAERSGLKGIPSELEGVPVQVKVIGKLYALTDPTAWQERPVPIGVSTGHPDVTAGTIGARVIDEDGNVYALSNNHVFANSNEATIGDSALQPGTYDGGVDSEDAIGTLYDYEEISFTDTNEMDAAIALSSTSDLDNSTPSDDGYGTPNTVTAEAYVDQEVQKYGRTTGLTEGTVGAINVTVNVCYDDDCEDIATFENQILIDTEGFSDGGDSGSLIVTNDSNNYPVALLFAGSDSVTIANPIDTVLERFNVTIDGAVSEEVTDIAIAEVEVSEESVAQEESVSVTVEVQNNGDQDATDLVVTLWDETDNEQISDTQTIASLTAGESTTLTFEWATDLNTSVGDHILTASHDFSDDDESNDTASTTVTVNEAGESAISLTATGEIIRRSKIIRLEWEGADTRNVIIKQNDRVLGYTRNDGSYTNRVRGRGTVFTYQVCEQDGVTCSNTETVDFLK